MACESNQKRTAQVELKINGKDVELNNFVENLISEVVIAMAKSLRGVGDFDTIDLKINAMGADSILRTLFMLGSLFDGHVSIPEFIPQP